MKRTGLFGGFFDPFTDAHKYIVEQALDQHLVDEIVIVPSIVNYHRSNKDTWLTRDQRVEVIKGKMRDRIGKDVVIDVCEYDTIDGIDSNLEESFCAGRRFIHTLLDLRNGGYGKHGQELYLILGTDEYNHFTEWFCWYEILKHINGIIAAGGRNFAELNLQNGVPKPSGVIDMPASLADVSASKVRQQYKGTFEAVGRYIVGLEPVHETVLNHTPIFDLVQKSAVQPGFYPVGLNAPDWVTVVARHKDRFLMVRQLRYGTMKEYTEFVCGQVDKGDSCPAAAAIRELKEETGISVDAAKVNWLGSFDTNPAFLNNKMHFYSVDLTDGDIASMKKQDLDEHERIEIQWLPANNVFDGIRRDDVMKLPAYMAFALLLYLHCAGGLAR